MAADQDARHVARQHGARVLRDLMTRAGLSGRSGYATIARLTEQVASDPAKGGISDQTVSNLVNSRNAARSGSVNLFIDACLYQQQANPQLAGEMGTPNYWRARFHDALGHVGDPHAGLVREGRPPRLAEAFLERPDVDLVAAAIEAQESVVITQPASITTAPPALQRERVFSGLGGVGKSQLAAKYARQMWHNPTLDLAIWVTARDPGQIVTAYANAAAQLLGVDPAHPEQAAERLMTWLSTTTRSWLIVLDDVQIPAKIQQWWPEPTDAGQVIVTTRYRGDSLRRTGRQVIEVGLYTLEQAVEYLLQRLASAAHLFREPDGPDTPDELLGALAKDLGYLPLALAHACAYLLDQEMPVPQYRELFADYRNRLETLFVRTDEYDDPHRDTVETTWAISIDLADRLVPGGLVPVAMLLASLLDPDGIPRAVFTTEAVANYLHGTLGHPVDKRDMLAAVRALHRLNLLTDNPSAQTGPVVTVHALVQRAARDSAANWAQEHPVLGDAAWAAGDALLEVWPKVERDADLVSALRSNTQMLTEVAQEQLWAPEAHPVLERVAHSFGEAGLIGMAITFGEWLLSMSLGRLGPDHPQTLYLRSILALWSGTAGDSPRAVKLLANVLDDQVRILGPQHPQTLITRNNLATFRGEAGDPAAAAAAYVDLIPDMARILGPDDPHTLRARGNLARWQTELGDLAAAAAALTDLIEAQERGLGPEDPVTLDTRDDLARALEQSGDLAGAAAEFTKLHDDYVRVLGPDHPASLFARGDLARLQGKRGDPVGAVAALTDLLDDQVQILGSDHRDTFIIRGDLALFQWHSGDPAGSTDSFTELVNDMVRVLGPDHPSTLTTRSNFALLQGEDDPAAGADALAELFDDMIRVLGPDHRHTLAMRGNTAIFRARAGDSAGAIAALTELLEDEVRVLGPDNPITVLARDNLSSLLKGS